ncbi:hypothetical protein D9M68_486540 [compost metagenome]
MALSTASRLSLPASRASRDNSATVRSDCSRRRSLISDCSTRLSCSARRMRSSSRSWRALPRSCSRLLPASSSRRSWDCAASMTSSALSWLRRSALSGLLCSLPSLSRLLIARVRVWAWLISAWARSGRVCAVTTRLLAPASSCCHSASWLLRSASCCSSCATELSAWRLAGSAGGVPCRRASSRCASSTWRGALASCWRSWVRRCSLSVAWSSSCRVSSSVWRMACCSASASLRSARVSRLRCTSARVGASVACRGWSIRPKPSRVTASRVRKRGMGAGSWWGCGAV